MKRLVMFVCIENAGRSQIAEAFAKKHGNDEIEAVSAGTTYKESSPRSRYCDEGEGC
ncbi:MAG: hypothetical protein FJ358_05210 [Thaumarchaeota archaeon]|nr:hypothetical protein [Nitrososphaerota archaeon]